MFYIRDADPTDVDKLSPHIPEEDKREIVSVRGFSPEYHLKLAILSSRCSKAVVDDNQNVYAIFGVGDGPEQSVGMPWLYIYLSYIPSKERLIVILRSVRHTN